MSATITSDILAKSWGGKGDALKFIRRNQIDLAVAQHEIALIKGRYAIRPIEIEVRELPAPTKRAPVAKKAQAIVAPESTPTPIVEPIAESDNGPSVADDEKQGDDEAPTAGTFGHGIRTLPTLLPIGTRREMPSNVLVEICAGTESGLYDRASALVWGAMIARKLRALVRIRDPQTMEILAETTGKKAPKARKVSAGGTRAGAGAGYASIYAALAGPDGVSTADLKSMTGWKSAPGESYLTILAKRKDLRLIIIPSETGKKRDRRFRTEPTTQPE